MFWDNLQVTHNRGALLEESHYYLHGLTMEGISSRSAGKLQNRNKFNGIEETRELDLNQYDAFFRNLDPQLGRWWQVDPQTEALESYSPYESMGNNPVSNVDPLGDFKTRFGAWLHSVFNGGEVHRNKYDEYYVSKTKVTVAENGDVIANAKVSYGNGRNAYSTAAEQLVRDYEIMDDIRKKGDNSMYQMYDSPKDAGKAALATAVGLAIPNVIIRPATITVNTAKAAAKGGGRAFWSGAGSEAKALEQGFGTLGQTRAGQNLIKLTEGMPYYPAMNGQPASQAYQWWARLSTQYAKGASGNINVFQNAQQGVSMQSIWRLYEYPTLLKNPNVTGIKFHY